MNDVSAIRWRIALFFGSVWAAGLVPPSPVCAQQTAHSFTHLTSFSLPSRLHGYVRQDSSTVVSPLHQALYRSADDSTNILVVSVSRLQFDATHPSSIEALHRILQTQAQRYLDSLPLGVTQGAYDAYRIAYHHVMDTTIKQVAVPGYTLSVAVRRQGTVALRFLYWYTIQGWLVQVRATMPEAKMATSTLPLFVHDLAGHVVRQVLAPQHH
jgi:hypothetical protein